MVGYSSRCTQIANGMLLFLVVLLQEHFKDFCVSVEGGKVEGAGEERRRIFVTFPHPQ